VLCTQTLYRSRPQPEHPVADGKQHQASGGKSRAGHCPGHHHAMASPLPSPKPQQRKATQRVSPGKTEMCGAVFSAGKGPFPAAAAPTIALLSLPAGSSHAGLPVLRSFSSAPLLPFPQPGAWCAGQ